MRALDGFEFWSRTPQRDLTRPATGASEQAPNHACPARLAGPALARCSLRTRPRPALVALAPAPRISTYTAHIVSRAQLPQIFPRIQRATIHQYHRDFPAFEPPIARAFQASPRACALVLFLDRAHHLPDAKPISKTVLEYVNSTLLSAPAPRTDPISQATRSRPRPS